MYRSWVCGWRLAMVRWTEVYLYNQIIRNNFTWKYRGGISMCNAKCDQKQCSSKCSIVWDYFTAMFFLKEITTTSDVGPVVAATLIRSKIQRLELRNPKSRITTASDARWIDSSAQIRFQLQKNTTTVHFMCGNLSMQGIILPKKSANWTIKICHNGRMEFYLHIPHVWNLVWCKQYVCCVVYLLITPNKRAKSWFVYLSVITEIKSGHCLFIWRYWQAKVLVRKAQLDPIFLACR